MICSKCGKELANDSKFCLFCGQPMAAAPAPAPMPQQAPQQYAPQQYQQPVQQAPQYAPQQYQQPMQQAPQQYAAPQQYQQPMYQQPAPAAPAYNPAGFAPVGQKAKKFDITKPYAIVTLASCLILFIALFLKYYATKRTKSGFSIASTLIKVATGYPYLINIILIVIFLVVGLKIGVFVMSILNTCYFGLVIILNENAIKAAKMTKYITRGPGFWVSIVGCVGILVGGILTLVARNSEKAAKAAPQYGVPMM